MVTVWAGEVGGGVEVEESMGDKWEQKRGKSTIKNELLKKKGVRYYSHIHTGRMQRTVPVDWKKFYPPNLLVFLGFLKMRL